MSHAVLTPVMQPISIPGQLSGTSIIRDLLSRIEQKLAQNYDLRDIDSYSGYSAEVQIRLQLRDVDFIEVHAPVTVGSLDLSQPMLNITLGGEVVAGGMVNLEKPVVEAQPVRIEQAVRIEQPAAAAPETIYREAPQQSVQQPQTQVHVQPQQRNYGPPPRDMGGKFIKRVR